MKPRARTADTTTRRLRPWPRPAAARSIANQTPAPATDGGELTYDLALLDQSRARWDSSPALRLVYGDIYRSMADFAATGDALEIGSGAGTITDHQPEVVTSDIRPTPYVDCVASAYALADAAGGPWSTIYALDVLHHLREPFRFFASAAAALRPGGRIVICDPAETQWGRIFYRLCHHEPMQAERLRAPYEFPPDSAEGDFANMGMASALFVRDATAICGRLADIGLTLRVVRYRDVLGYPASGGFSGPRLVPAFLVRALLRIDRLLPQAWLRHLALRVIVVLEKQNP